MAQDYAKVYSSFWTGETGKAIRAQGGDAQRVAFYLMTCQSSNSIGLYYLPLVLVSHEVGIPFEGASEALRRLSEVDFVHLDLDNEMVWVTNQARRQLGESMLRTDKRHGWLVGELNKLKTSLVKLFYAEYASAYSLTEKDLPRAFEGPSKGLRRPSDAQYPIPNTQYPDPNPHPNPHPNASERGGGGSGEESSGSTQDEATESRVVSRAEPTRPENAVPERFEIETTSAPSEVRPTQPWVTQALPHVPIVRTREAVLAVPINDRAKWYLANQHQFCAGANDWAMPHTWPEIIEPIQEFHRAAKLAEPRLENFKRDDSVRITLEHYASDHSVEDLTYVYRTFPTSEWFLARVVEGKRPDPSWVTSRVLKKALSGAPKSSTAPLELARIQVEREKTAKSARLVAEIEHTQSLITESGNDWSMPATQLTGGSAPRALPGGKR